MLNERSSQFTAVSTAINGEIKRYGRRPGDDSVTNINGGGEILWKYFFSIYICILMIIWGIREEVSSWKKSFEILADLRLPTSVN